MKKDKKLRMFSLEKRRIQGDLTVLKWELIKKKKDEE